ncbi:putative leucine-rich repeat domain superfamily [Helianthus annuus]|nr:putative leucine-rich repeat domain superfamily [Helianthus annuus]
MLNNLSLAHNNLQGSIPDSLGKLISLEILDLSQNNLSGMIPRSLETLRYLEYLNLSYNRLQGEIPSGGRFNIFTASSFRHNKDLCGAAKLEVLPCRNKQKESRNLSSLKYISPIIATIIGLVVAIYLLRRHKRLRKQNRTNVVLDSRFITIVCIRITTCSGEHTLICRHDEHTDTI